MIQISPTAAKEIQRLLRRRHPNGGLVRIDIEPGGCEEWVYSLTAIEAPETTDFVAEVNHVSIALTPLAYSYLGELTIDYSEDLMGGGFRFTNPKATMVCGCGNSFSLGPDQATSPPAIGISS